MARSRSTNMTTGDEGPFRSSSVVETARSLAIDIPQLSPAIRQRRRNSRSTDDLGHHTQPYQFIDLPLGVTKIAQDYVGVFAEGWNAALTRRVGQRKTDYWDISN